MQLDVDEGPALASGFANSAGEYEIETRIADNKFMGWEMRQSMSNCLPLPTGRNQTSGPVKS